MINTETFENYPRLKDCFEKQIHMKEEAGKERTASNYRSAWNKFSSFLGKRKSGEITLADLTTDLIQHYLLWLLQDEDTGNALLSPGSQDFYLRNLKAMYNKVIKELRFISPSGNPFSNLYIQVPPTRKRALAKEELKRLSELDLSDTPEKFAALHLALFLFYARGMCFVDAFKLKKENLNGDYMHYIRSKTGATLQVKITPEMNRIIHMYHRKDSPWLFPFLHDKIQGKGTVTAQSSLHRINGYLKQIGNDLGYLQPLTTYVMRHSWASMMLEAGAEIGVISQSMGHTSLHTTEIYLGQLSRTKMDKATDKMLDILVRKTAPERKGTYPKTANNKRSKKTTSHPHVKTLGMRCKNMLASIAKILMLTT